MSQIMDVIVIGCGASGIAALRRLHDAGLKVIGLEAADRIGGRVYSVEYGEGKVDLGGAWYEGDPNHEVYHLTKLFNLLEKEEPANTWYVMSNGELVSNDKGSDIVKFLNDSVQSAHKNTNISIPEHIREVANTNKTLQEDSKLANSFVEWYERHFHVGGQNDPKEGKSLRYLEECLINGTSMMNWKGKGYHTILDILLNRYPDPSKELPIQILLNKEVESIKWSTSRRGSVTENPLVHVKCKDGSLLAAKSVIVTVSVGVLKERHQQLFNPPLPKEKVNAINNFQMCVLGKIYIEFTKPWWPKTPASFALLWRDEDKAKFSADEKWITEIYGLDSVAHQPNLLLTWIYGNGAVQMEKTSEEKVKAGVIKLLDLMFTKFDVAPVKSIIRTQWGTNPLTRGAYAYRSVAVEENGGSIKILSEPLYHGDSYPIVCFAGEATSYHNHTAVHGAIETGFREADRLIKALQNLS